MGQNGFGRGRLPAFRGELVMNAYERAIARRRMEEALWLADVTEQTVQHVRMFLKRSWGELSGLLFGKA